MNNSIILYKKILLAASKSFNAKKNFDVKLSDYSDEDIFYSIKKLDEMGVVEAMDWSDSAGIEFVIRDITSIGWGMLACRTCLQHLSTAGRGRGMAEIWLEAPLNGTRQCRR